MNGRVVIFLAVLVMFTLCLFPLTSRAESDLDYVTLTSYPWNAVIWGDLGWAVKPGMVFGFQTSSARSTFASYYVGYSIITIPVPAGTDFVPEQSSSGFQLSNRTLTIQAPSLGVSGYKVVFKVRAASKLGAVRAVNYRPHIKVYKADGIVLEGDDAYDLPIVGLPAAFDLDMTYKTQKPKVVTFGETYHCILNAVTNVSLKKMDLLATLGVPPSTAVIVPGSITLGGHLNGQRISWTFAKAAKARVEFDVKVGKEADIPATLKKITANVTAKGVKTNLDVFSTTKTFGIRIYRGVPITGRVNNVILNGYPADRNSVKANSPLSGVAVRLIKQADKSVADTDVSDNEGLYTVAAMDPGEYVLEFRKKANRYSRASNNIDDAAVNVVQKRSLTIAPDQTQAVEMETVYLPVNLTNFLAKLIYRLNHLRVPFQSGAVTLPLLKFNTLGVEAFVDNLLADQDEVMHDEFSGDPPVNPPDTWNAAVRLAAALAMIDCRYRDAAKLADDVTKMTALLLTQAMIKHVAKVLKFPGPAGVAQAELRRLKVNVMDLGIGVLLPQALDLAGIQGQDKAIAMEVMSKMMRFGMDLLTNQWMSDLAFEAIFDTLRAGMIKFLLELAVTANDGTYQQLIDQAAAKAANRIYSPLRDHRSALVAADALNDKASERVLWVRTGANSAGQVYSLLRGLEGAYRAQKTALDEWWKDPAAAAEPVLSRLKIARFLEKMAPAFRVVGVVSMTAALTLPCAEIWAQEGQVQGIVGVCFSGPVGSATVSNSPAIDPVDDVQTFEEPFAEPLESDLVGGVSGDYLGLLNKIERAVQNGRSGAYANLRDELMAADTAYFDGYLEPIFARCEAAKPILNTAAAKKAVNLFLERRDTASIQAALFYAELEAWAAGPSLALADIALSRLADVREAVSNASTSAAAANLALSSLTIPGFAYLTEADLPRWINGGDTVQLRYRVKNVGELTLAAGTATIFPSDGKLILGGPADLNIPALAPGQTYDISWTVHAVNHTYRTVAHWEIILTGPAMRPGFAGGGILIYPP